jgi:hypothetical protein
MSEVFQQNPASSPPSNTARNKHEPQTPTPVLSADGDNWIDEKIENLLTSMHGGSRKREHYNVASPDAVASPKKRTKIAPVPNQDSVKFEKPLACHFCGRPIWSRHSFHNHMSANHRDGYQELRKTHGVDEIMNLGVESRTVASPARLSKRVHFSPCEQDTRPPVRSNVWRNVFVNEPLTQAELKKGTFITVPVGAVDDDEDRETESDEAAYEITELSDEGDKAKDLIPTEVSSTPLPKKKGGLVRTRKLYSDIMRSLEELDEEHHLEKTRHLAAKIAEHRRHAQFKESFAPRYRALLLELGCHTYMSIDDPLK